MEFRLLGPVQIWDSDSLVDAGPPRQLNVLAALAVDSGRPVSIEALIDRVWDSAPPVRARHVIYSYIARLRRVILASGGGTAIVRRSGGYELEAHAGQVDVRRFHALLAAARRPSASDVEQVDLINEAFQLWRGAPLSNFDGTWANQVREGLHLQRIEAARWWAQAHLRLNQPELAVGPISALIAEYPMVESLVGVLMRNLAAAGRGAEALEHYAALRTRLADELGADPSPDVQAAYRSVLRRSDGQVSRAPVGPPPRGATAAGPVRRRNSRWTYAASSAE